MSDPFIGHITMFTGNYIPHGYAECNGQLMPIAGNETLYSVLGTQFGGDGHTNFALPDFRGRIPVGQGAGPGIDPIPYGQQAGTETVTLNQDQTPTHTHQLTASKGNATEGNPCDNLFAVMDATNSSRAYHESPADLEMRNGTLSSTGGSQPHNNMMPYMVVRYIIAVQGYYPQRS
jgi:microcystin-dependent protein